MLWFPELTRGHKYRKCCLGYLCRKEKTVLSGVLAKYGKARKSAELTELQNDYNGDQRSVK